MNPETVNLVLQLAALAAKIAIDVKAQSGLSDAELLALAESNDAATRELVKDFLAKLG